MGVLHAAELVTVVPAFKATPLVAGKIFFAALSGYACLYFLNTGKKRRDLDRLIWAGVFGLLTALVFAL